MISFVRHPMSLCNGISRIDFFFHHEMFIIVMKFRHLRLPVRPKIMYDSTPPFPGVSIIIFIIFRRVFLVFLFCFRQLRKRLQPMSNPPLFTVRRVNRASSGSKKKSRFSRCTTVRLLFEFVLFLLLLYGVSLGERSSSGNLCRFIIIPYDYTAVARVEHYR